MNRIFKYVLPAGVGRSIINLPIGARVVHFAVQDNNFCVWAIIDDESDVEVRTFWVRSTGAAVIDETCFLFTTIDGPFVWHLFTRIG